MELTKQYIEEAEKYILHTYNRFPIVFEKGEGVYLYDVEGKRYLDFYGGIAVFPFGHCQPEFNQALSAQLEKLIHISNLYYNRPVIEAAKSLVQAAGMDKVFFTNSGTEAIEGAIKAARKYAYLKDGSTDHEIIAMGNSFHGRSMGALSVTGNVHYQEAFKPLIGGIQFARFNDLSSVEEKVNAKTCAIILETVQGEGGIYPADEEFLKGVEEICKKHDILLILDEIQCGMGRCGSMFAFQQYGVSPDIITVAKALGGGFPVGAFLLNEKASKHSLTAGDHGSTYGGNPFAAAAVNVIFSLYKKYDIINHVKEITPYFEAKLDSLVEQCTCVKARRGKGLMQGLELQEKSVSTVVSRALEEGLIVISAGANVLRMVPPLVIEKEHIDEMFSILQNILSD